MAGTAALRSIPAKATRRPVLRMHTSNASGQRRARHSTNTEHVHQIISRAFPLHLPRMAPFIHPRAALVHESWGLRGPETGIRSISIAATTLVPVAPVLGRRNDSLDPTCGACDCLPPQSQVQP